MIKVNRLEKYFNRRQKNEIHVLNDISITFPDKGLVVLHGPSGSGKTTLLNVIGGLDKLSSGVIQFGDERIERYNAATWDEIRNENVGYVFQNYNLLPNLSVFDNIAFVLKMIGITDPKIVEQRVNYILKAVNMYPFRKKKGLQLSGGQQQRVAIARALVKNPKVIIADEPTGNLDSKNTLDIMNIIKQISLDKLVILVTHEKEIAKFYGDRIIELKDGQIVNDYQNSISENYDVENDDTIYLKDLTPVSRYQDENVELHVFNDEKERTPISIRLIVKNKTLYLDIDSNLKKIRLVDDSSGVIIKDEKYIKKTREELIETAFDSQMLDNKEVKVQSRSVISFRQTFIMAFQKIIATSAKGKLMLFSFFTAGIVIAITIAVLAAALIVNPEPSMPISQGHVSVFQYHDDNAVTYDDVLATKQDGDTAFFINVYGRIALPFTGPGGSVLQTGVFGQVVLTQDVEVSDLFAGKMPENKQEILISKSLAEELVKRSEGQEMGIWSYQHIFHEKLLFQGQEMRIVGIVDTEVRLIFMERTMAAFVALSRFSEILRPYHLRPYQLFSNSDLVAGAMPKLGEVVISEGLYEILTLGNDYPGSWPKILIDGETEITVSGIHSIENGDLIRLLTNNDIERFIFSKSSNMFFIATNDTERLIAELELLPGIQLVSDVFQGTYDEIKQQQQMVLVSTLGTSAFLIGFSLLGFYFVIRSSLISRIYEVSVYRALGVKKKDVFRSFVIEIFVLTTISTLLGYLLAVYALNKLQAGLLGEFQFFAVSPLSVILGIALLYLLNMLAGLFPVFLLLRRTPAQILSQYDI